MKKDLDFANTEIERLRAKLVFEDCDMPSLSMEMFGNSKLKSPNFENEVNTSHSNNSDNIYNLKEAIN